MIAGILSTASFVRIVLYELGPPSIKPAHKKLKIK